MTNLKAKTDVRIGSTWYKAGDDIPADHRTFDYEKAARKGLIEAEDGHEITNPEPEAATPTDTEPSAETTRLQGELDSIRALFPKVKSTDELLAQVKELQSGRKADRDEATRLQGELTKAQASAANPEDAAALAEYREVVGDLLPHDFPSRKILLENGYYTLDTVTGAADEDLTNIDGIADGKLADIRKVAPYSGE